MPPWLAIVAAGYAVLVVGVWMTVYPVNDYAGFIAGARGLLAGIDPYDARVWPTAFASLGTQRPDTSIFGYPPWIAVAFLPFAPLPLAVGSLLWSAGTLALACLAIRGVTRRFAWGSPAWPLALAAFSWPAFLVFVQGQWGYLLLALAGMALLDLEAHRDLRAGTWWAIALLAKPQLFVVGSIALLAWLIAQRRWAVLIGAALVAGGMIVVGTLVSPGWIEPYVADVVTRRAARSIEQPTLAGLAGDIAGPVLWPIAWALFAATLLAASLLAVRRSPARQRGPVAFAGILVVSVATALYSWSYDQYLAILAGVVAIGVSRQAGPWTARAVLVCVAALYWPIALALFISAYARYHDTLAGLVPPLALALLVIVAVRARRLRPLTGSA
jgi:hypothetical protein